MLKHIRHLQFCHMSMKGMDVVVTEGYITYKEVQKLKFCENCTRRKGNKHSFITNYRIFQNNFYISSFLKIFP